MTDFVLTLIDGWAEWLATLEYFNDYERNIITVVLAMIVFVIMLSAMACALYGAVTALFKSITGRVTIKDD